MARKLPKPLARRDILYGVDTPPDILIQRGTQYLEAGLVFDAVEFFARAGHRPGLAEMREAALEMGDAFLLRKVQEAAPDLVGAADWQTLAARAKELGKDTYAERAAAGGTPPPPPLQEEAKIEEVAAPAEGEGAAPAAGGTPSPGAPGAPGAHGKARKSEIQGG